MKKFYLSIIALIFGVYSYADQLDGLAIFEFLIYVIMFGGVCFITLIITALIRFSYKENKVSPSLNISAILLILCAIISIGNLGSSIDGGFLAFCLSTIALALLLIFLNYRVGSSHRNSQVED
ncbi:hypothetical protein [Crocinitomix algicola]|uniref:hypothetical protein n=1 Tax=Crocinitomix algicola TaxID=1740263 RepID=UPI0008376FFA|nr:hypothetical protein [Crocinitomix algicola]